GSNPLKGGWLMRRRKQAARADDGLIRWRAQRRTPPRGVACGRRLRGHAGASVRGARLAALHDPEREGLLLGGEASAGQGTQRRRRVPAAELGLRPINMSGGERWPRTRLMT